MESDKLSLVIPCYNEESTLESIVDEVLKLKDEIALELVVVDDCSTDGSREVAQKLAAKHSEIKLCFHDKNMGKGAALRTGFMETTGDFVGIQDADTEDGCIRRLPHLESPPFGFVNHGIPVFDYCSSL